MRSVQLVDDIEEDSPAKFWCWPGWVQAQVGACRWKRNPDVSFSRQESDRNSSRYCRSNSKLLFKWFFLEDFFGSGRQKFQLKCDGNVLFRQPHNGSFEVGNERSCYHRFPCQREWVRRDIPCAPTATLSFLCPRLCSSLSSQYYWGKAGSFHAGYLAPIWSLHTQHLLTFLDCWMQIRIWSYFQAFSLAQFLQEVPTVKYENWNWLRGTTGVSV